MEFPKLDGDPLIDYIINKCWHNNYATIAELAIYTETLLPGKTIGGRLGPKQYPFPNGVWLWPVLFAGYGIVSDPGGR
jgi:hypothetical protein